jgi:hypothetical protein
MEIRALIIWHYYKDGVLSHSSTTWFQGTAEQLQKNTSQKEYEEGGKLPELRKGSPYTVICHAVTRI